MGEPFAGRLPPLHELQRKGAQVPGAHYLRTAWSDVVALDRPLRKPQEAGTMNPERLRITLGHQPGVVFRVGGVPAPTAAVRDPKAAFAAGEANDQVDVRVDLPPVVNFDWLVELDLDRSVAAEIDLRERIAAQAQPREDEVGEDLDEILRSAAVAIGSVNAERFVAAVDLDPAVGVLERTIMCPVSDGTRHVPGAGGVVLHRNVEHQVAARLRLLEHRLRHGDLSEDVFERGVGGAGGLAFASEGCSHLNSSP